MNVSASPDVMSTTISAPQPVSRPMPIAEGGGAAGSRDSSASDDSTGGALQGEAKDALLAGAAQLKDSGAGLEEIQSFVDNRLEASGAGERTGQLVDMTA